jgi:hypothetical protein
MAEQEKKKTRKKPRTQKSQTQYIRTARNKEKRRKRHAVANPRDSQAIANWKKSPIRTSRTGK